MDSIENIRDIFSGAPSQDANRPQISIGMQVGDGDNAPIREKILMRMPKEMLPKSTEPCRAITARFTPGDTLFYTGWTGNLANLYTQYVAATLALGKSLSNGRDSTFDQQFRSAMGGAQTDEQAAKALELFKGEMSLMVSYVPKPTAKMDTLVEGLQNFTFVVALELDKENATADQTFHQLMQNVEAATGQTRLRAGLR